MAAKVLVTGLLAAAFAASPLIVSAQVPDHLARMAASLFKQTEESLRAQAGGEGRAYAVKRALVLIDDQRLGNWAAAPVAFPHLERLSETLGLDLSLAADREALLVILDAQADGKLDEALALELARRGEPAEEADVNALRQAFDQTWNAIFEELPTRHEIAWDDSPESLVLDWQPRTQQFDLLYDHEGDAWNAPMRTVMRAKARPEPKLEDGEFKGFEVAAKPAAEPLSAYSPADLLAISTQIYGTWYNGEDVWVIAKPDGSIPEEEEGPPPESIAEKIHEKEDELDAIRKDKVYLWRNAETGETERQSRFRRLDEPWVYDGETYAQADAEARIEALEAEIEQLRGQVDQVPPIDQYDPVGFESDEGGSEPLRITVTFATGYSFTYDEARFDGNKVTARRVLRDQRDIEDLPQIIINGLIASWSPPEWIELKADLDPDGGGIALRGPLYRLHVTYSTLFGEPTGEISGIHTPFVEDNLNLVPDQRKAP